MKKLICFVLIFVLTVSMCGCNAKDDNTQKTTDNTNTLDSKEPSTEYVEYKVGDYIQFGSYEQDNNQSNGKEPIEWRVLEVKDDKLLVISKYGLDCIQYHSEENVDITWELCTLRQWMNDTFFNTAFSNEEKRMIALTDVPAHENPYGYNTTPGNPTKDKVFALSVQEIFEYFISQNDVNCIATAYAEAKGANASEKGYTSWWLRTPSVRQIFVTYVSRDVEFTGDEAIPAWHEWTSVRPALWIDLNPDNEETTSKEPLTEEPTTEEPTTEEPTTKPQKTVTKLTKILKYGASNIGYSITDIIQYEYNIKGNLSSETIAWDGIYKYEYNEDNKISIIYFSDSESTEKKIFKKYEYDENGYLIKVYGESLLIEEYEYDTKGNMIKKIEYDDDMSVLQSYTYEYDSNSRLTKDVLYYSTGYVNQQNSYFYDENGNLVNQKHYYTQPDPQSEYNYEYDEQGKLIRKDYVIYWNSPSPKKYYYIYEYDANSNIIKETEYLCTYNGDTIYTYTNYTYEDIVVEIE